MPNQFQKWSNSVPLIGQKNILLANQQPRSQRPRSFWLATGIATSGQLQLQKSAIHGLPVTLRMPRVKSDKSNWFWSQSILFTDPFKTRMSLDLARGPDFYCMTKGTPGEKAFSSPEPRSFWPAAGIESSWSNHFEITKEISEFCPSGLTKSSSMAHA